MAVLILIVAWLGVTAITLGTIVVERGQYSVACGVPGTDSSYGHGNVSLVPLGIYCSYPYDETGVAAIPDDPRPPMTNLIPEGFIIGVPILGAFYYLRRRRSRGRCRPDAS